MPGTTRPPVYEPDSAVSQGMVANLNHMDVLSLQCAPAWGAPTDGTLFTAEAFARYSVATAKVRSHTLPANKLDVITCRAFGHVKLLHPVSECT